MKFLRLAFFSLTFSSFSFAANKDLIALQRSLEDKIDAMQQALSTKLDTLAGQIQAVQTDSRLMSQQVAGMQDVLRNTVTSSLAPVSGLGQKVEATSEDVRSLRDALADLSARLERMDAKITDVKNSIQIMQNPPPAPGANGTGANPLGVIGAPGQGTTGQPSGPGGVPAGPPAGMSAEKTYTDARRDQQTGNLDLALQEYQQYLTYFPNTELAANAQYYIGEISYNRARYQQAIDSFDAVLERYPQNPRTRDAQLLKGLAYAHDGQRTKATTELRALIQKYPASEQARRASAALRDPSLFPSAAPGRRTR